MQKVMIAEQFRFHAGSYPAKYLLAIILLFITLSLCEAQAEVEKLSNEEEILAAFESGEEKIKVIIGLEMPQHLKGIKSYKSQEFKSQVRAEISDRQSNVLSGLSADEFVLSHRYINFECFAGEVTLEGLDKLLAHPLVRSVELSRLEHKMLAQGIGLINGMVYRSSYNGQNVSIAISDTGVDYTHPKLGGGGFPNSKVIGGYDAGDDDSNPFPNGQAHGTACAGIAAGGLGTVGDYIGGVGYNAKIYAMKISFGSGGSAYDTDVIQAWDWCVSHQYDDPSNPIMIISHSFGGGRYFSASSAESDRPSYAAAAGRAVAAGITIFAASGNEGYCDSIASPAAFSDIISVGSVYDSSMGTVGFCIDRDSCASEHESQCSPPWACWDLGSSADEVSCYSNSATFLDLLAPAHDAYTTDISGSGGYESGDYLTDFGGTSAACPYAAGAAACLQSAAKILTGSYLTPQEVRDVLVNTGDDITDGKVAITKPRINLGNAIDDIISGSSTIVPDVVGMPEASATAAITSAGLVVGTVTYACSDTVPVGDVISQNPTGGTSVSPGSSVDFVVSTGQPSVPDITGTCDLPAIIALIDGIADISFGSITYQCSDTVPDGCVISQSVTGPATCGGTVDLVVSTGQPTVPDVTGMDEASAIAAINAVSDISVGTVVYACSDTVAAGNVISQSVTGLVPCSSTVDLLISTGQPIVPDLGFCCNIPCITAAINAVANLSVGTITYACSDTVPAGCVISQNPPPGPASCGSPIDLVISTGQPTVPDVTGQAEAMAIANINAVSGITVGTVTYVCSDTVAAGIVISQSITGAVPCNSPVDLVVSTGQPTVPDLRDDIVFDAIAILDGISDVSYGTTIGGCDGSVAVGSVISQSETGTVACGTVIDIIVSVGRQLVPDVTGMDEASAIAAIDPRRFISVGVVTYEYSMVPFGNVISQDPNAGFVPCDSTVDLVVSGGPPLSDNFDDNIRSAMWRELRNDLTDVRIIEDANQLNIISVGGDSYQEAAYTANGWSIDVSTDFQIKVDFHFSGTDPNYSWAGVTIENGDGYAILAAGSDGGAAYYFADANSITDQISRASEDGTLYVSYDSVLNELYLSYTGYGSANAWQNISGMLQGTGPATISVGGGSDRVILNSGRAYLDNFEVTAGAPLGWPVATDLDGDGFIGLGDLVILSNYWLGVGPEGDITDDGSVDLNDFAELYRAW